MASEVPDARRILSNLPYLLKQTTIACFDDGLFTVAKGAAYSALLSFFPILTTAATVFLQVRADYVQRSLAGFLEQILPPGTEKIVLDQFQHRGARPGALLVIAVLLSVWAASSVFKSLMDGFNEAYRVPQSRSIVAHNAVSLMLVIFSAGPIFAASSLLLFGGTVERLVLTLLRIDPVLMPLSDSWKEFSRLLRYAVAILATISMTCILYYYGPYRKQRWGGVLPGAILATVLWIIAGAGFAWYVRNITNYNVLYGSVGSSIALLIWMYVISAIALIGCEFNAEIERLR